MASGPSSGRNNQTKKKLKKEKKRARVKSEEQLERFDSLPWNPSLPDKDDAYSFLIGSNELEGGSLPLPFLIKFKFGDKFQFFFWLVWLDFYWEKKI